jgi:hypothetical protein
MDGRVIILQGRREPEARGEPPIIKHGNDEPGETLRGRSLQACGSAGLAGGFVGGAGPGAGSGWAGNGDSGGAGLGISGKLGGELGGISGVAGSGIVGPGGSGMESGMESDVGMAVLRGRHKQGCFPGRTHRCLVRWREGAHARDSHRQKARRVLLPLRFTVPRAAFAAPQPDRGRGR